MNENGTYLKTLGILWHYYRNEAVIISICLQLNKK